MKTKVWPMLSLAVAWACGPDPERDAPVSRVSSALIYFQPIGVAPIYQDLVGRGLNGQSWNGKVLDGRMVTSVSLDGVLFPSGKKKDLKLKATMFKGAPGPKATGVVGAVFSAALDDGDTILLRVDGVEARGEPKAAFYAYQVRYYADGAWQPLCGEDGSGAPVPAIPLNGRWDYREGVVGGGSYIEDHRTFTFACEGRVLAKCVAMGYAPWQKGFLCTVDGAGKKTCVKTTLQPFHQACTRAMRADYCGDGLSHTEEGEWTLLYDGIGIRADTEAWAIEAEWDERGARCLSRERVEGLGTIPCGQDLASELCGDPAHFEAGTLLMTEVPLDGVEG